MLMVNCRNAQPGSQETWSLPVSAAVTLCHSQGPQWLTWEDFPENLWVFRSLVGWALVSESPLVAHP